MSPTFNISLSIWARTLLVNIILFGCYAYYEEGFIAVFGLILMIIGAFLATLPLLVIIHPLVRWMAVIAYTPASRLASLGFMLILVAVAFYIVGASLVLFVSGTEIFSDKRFQLLVCTTAISVILAVWSVKTAFVKLNYDKHEEQLG